VLSDYLPILLMLGLATLFAVASIFIASKVGPFNPTPAKLAPYECGIVPERTPRERFPIKFYLIAMLFIIFDVEVIFFYPFAVIFRELGLFGLAWEEEGSIRHSVSRMILERARPTERIGA